MSSYSYTSSSSSTSYTSSSTTNNGQTTTTGSRQAQHAYTDPSGNTTVHSASQNLGEPIVSESAQYDSQGRQLVGGGEGAGRITEGGDAEEKQKANDAAYDEAIEDEYAKREGGA